MGRERRLYDHVKLPNGVKEMNPETHQLEIIPYGPRVPLIAWGRFARSNYISHIGMDHSSIVKFIEWNWLNGKTGQLGTRDVWVNNIGSLLDPAFTGTKVPETITPEPWDPKCKDYKKQLAAAEAALKSNYAKIKTADPQHRHELAFENAQTVRDIARLKARLKSCPG